MEVDIDEVDIRILERSLGGAGEVVVGCANADHKICFARRDVCAECSRCANCAEAGRMIIRQGTFACL